MCFSLWIYSERNEDYTNIPWLSKGLVIFAWCNKIKKTKQTKFSIISNHMAFHPVISDLRAKVLHILQWPRRRKKNTKDVFKKKHISTKAFFFFKPFYLIRQLLVAFTVKTLEKLLMRWDVFVSYLRKHCSSLIGRIIWIKTTSLWLCFEILKQYIRH